MTEQRIFPFFVNGQIWRTIEVDECDIQNGRKVMVVMSKLSPISDLDDAMPEMMATSQRVCFQLAQIREYYPENKPKSEQEEDVESYKSFKNYMAEWFTGFWVCDKRLVLEDSRLYLRKPETAEVG